MFADHGVFLLSPAIKTPRLAFLNDAEQLAFTDKLGARVNFTSRVPGGNKSAQDVYTITLDPKINTELEYVLGT